jgi:hypothetical protein
MDTREQPWSYSQPLETSEGFITLKGSSWLRWRNGAKGFREEESGEMAQKRGPPSMKAGYKDFSSCKWKK